MAVLAGLLVIASSCCAQGEALESPVGADQTAIELVSLNQCGPYSLHVCAAALGHDVTHLEIERLLGADDAESSLSELEAAAQHMGLDCRGLRWTGAMADFAWGEAPAVIPITDGLGRRHFIAVLESRKGSALVVDFPRRPAWVSFQDLQQRWKWQGEALHLGPQAGTLQQLDGETGRSSSAVLLLFGAAAALVLLPVAIRHRGAPARVPVRAERRDRRPGLQWSRSWRRWQSLGCRWRSRCRRCSRPANRRGGLSA